MKANKLLSLTALISLSLIASGCGNSESSEQSFSTIGDDSTTSITSDDPSTGITDTSDDTTSDTTSDDTTSETTSDSSDTPIEDNNPMKNYTRKLYKKKDKPFKIMTFTDIQLDDGDSTDLSFHIIDTFVEQEQPDLIAILGDIINDDAEYGCKNTFMSIISHLDSLDIPWAPVFGNHDQEYCRPSYSLKDITTEEMSEEFAKCENCMFIRGPQDVTGKSNYLINVYEEGTDKLFESLIFADSGGWGMDDTHAAFYEDCVNYAKELNNGEIVPSVFFDHIPLKQYEYAFEQSEANEFRDVVGCAVVKPHATNTTEEVFNKIKEYGSTTICICGHDHENAYYSEYEGVKLAFSMKTSEGNDIDGDSFKFGLGGACIELDGENEEIRYDRIGNVPFSVSPGFANDYHPNQVPYWRYSGAKLNYDIELPDSGIVYFCVMGTNFNRAEDWEDKAGSWNRLTSLIKIDASNKTATYGTLTHVKDNLYHYEGDVSEFPLNVDGGQLSYGDETARLVYFRDATANFKVDNLTFVIDEVTATNQIDLKDCIIDTIADQFYQNGDVVRPMATVKYNGQPLTFIDDIFFTYENNRHLGKATITAHASGKGANKYKGQISTTFNIITNPDDDTLPGHENAIIVNTAESLGPAKFITLPDWYNSGKKLHIEVKPLQYGASSSGTTARFSFMGTNLNPDSHSQGSNWSRFTMEYYMDFANNTVTVYRVNKSAAYNIAIVTPLEDGWFSVDIPLNSLELNSTEGVYGNDKETLERWNISELTRSFKYDNVSAIN